jgi:hypothetical protein
MNNKEKNTRIVTFKEDYVSQAALAGEKAIGVKAQPLYKKGSTHAIHHLVVKSLLAKGAKMDVKKHDPEPGVKRLKEQLKNDLKTQSN